MQAASFYGRYDLELHSLDALATLKAHSREPETTWRTMGNITLQ